MMLGGSFLFYQSLPQEDRQDAQLSPVAAISVCMALIQFICTLVFHVVRQLKSRRVQAFLKKKKRTQLKVIIEEGIKDKSDETGGRERTTTTQVVELNTSINTNDWREPLLGDD